MGLGETKIWSIIKYKYWLIIRYIYSIVHWNDAVIPGWRLRWFKTKCTVEQEERRLMKKKVMSNAVPFSAYHYTLCMVPWQPMSPSFSHMHKALSFSLRKGSNFFRKNWPYQCPDLVLNFLDKNGNMFMP